MGTKLLRAIRKNMRDIKRALATSGTDNRPRLEAALVEAKKMEKEAKSHV